MTEAHEATKSEKANGNGTRTSAAGKANAAAMALDARLSGPLAPLEKSLDDVLGEKASFQLPTGLKDFLVKVAPWLSLGSGIFGLISAFGLWRTAHYINQFVDYANQWSAAYGGPTQPKELGVLFWLSIIMMVLFSVLALLAFPGLKARKKAGWNIMFYSLLVSVLYSVVSLFYYSGGVSSFIGTLLGAAIGLYILFQVRSRYVL